MATVLAVDTVTEACSVALWTGERMITRFEEPGRGHALRVLPMVDAVLAEAMLRLTDLDGIAAVIGPGAFTGVRISVSVAQGLAFGAGLPVVAVTSLESLALQALARTAAPERVLACLDARMGELYWGEFRADAMRGVIDVGGLHLSTPAQLAASMPGAKFGIGRGIAVLQSLNLWPHGGDAMALPRAEEAARIGARRLAAGEGIDPGEIQPVYLRDKVALTEAERAALKS